MNPYTKVCLQAVCIGGFSVSRAALLHASTAILMDTTRPTGTSAAAKPDVDGSECRTGHKPTGDSNWKPLTAKVVSWLQSVTLFIYFFALQCMVLRFTLIFRVRFCLSKPACYLALSARVHIHYAVIRVPNLTDFLGQAIQSGKSAYRGTTRRALDI